MKTYVIEQKMSNSGSIHVLNSDQFDRVIKFPANHNYAVVCAAYYGGKGYTTHKTLDNAVRASKKASEYSHAVIDADGNNVDIR